MVGTTSLKVETIKDHEMSVGETAGSLQHSDRFFCIIFIIVITAVANKYLNRQCFFVFFPFFK